MKLRIVASGKDILIFVIFAIFLLYIVALGVLNLPQLASEGTFYGLNPFEAFSPDYIWLTLVFYILVLGGLFFSVSSYFFEFEQGFGLGVSSKNSGGYSSWAKAKEFKEDKTIKRVVASDPDSKYAGIPLISNGKELWVDDGEYHNLVIGATGSGKTVSTILPTVKVLAKKGESIICTDPKGEIYEKTGGLLKKRGYNIILLNFRNPQNGNAWNPLSLPYQLYKSGNQDKAIELLDDLALNILYEENSGNSDPFWEKTAADYFAGIALAMFEDTTEDKININSINMTATVGEDKFGGSTYIKEYFNYKDPSSAAYVNASGTVMAPSETKGGIISVFKQKVKLFASRENLSEMLSYSDFELADIGKKPTAVFVIIQDEKKTYHSLATIFIKQVYETLIDVAQQSGGKLPCRTNFLLDEFANMPPLKDVTTMITAARSRQIRFTMIIQNFAQLNKVYGKDDAETIKGNCGNIIYLISSELAALEEISKLCGEKKSKKDDKTASTPLATVSDLQRMKQFDQIVLRMRKHPFKTSFVPDFKIDWGGCVSGKVDYPTRDKKEVQIFDIREFVKNKKNQKINEMMASMGGGAPAANGSSSSSSPIGGGSSKPKTTPELSVNDLVKKIDQKLAEIEKEEQEQKRKKEQGLAAKTPSSVPPKKEVSYSEPNPFVYNDPTNVNRFDNVDKGARNDINKKYEDKSLSDKKYNDKIDSYFEQKYSNKTEAKIDDKENTKIEKSILTDDLDVELLSDDIKIESKKDDYKFDRVTSYDIENKVNNKIADDILEDIDNDYDLLTPIERKINSSKYDSYLSEKESMVSSLDKKFREFKEQEANNNYKATSSLNSKFNNSSYMKEEVDASVDTNISAPVDLAVDDNRFKPTTSIKLEDISEDDKFFDDFFED